MASKKISMQKRNFCSSPKHLSLVIVAKVIVSVSQRLGTKSNGVYITGGGTIVPYLCCTIVLYYGLFIRVQRGRNTVQGQFRRHRT